MQRRLQTFYTPKETPTDSSKGSVTLDWPGKTSPEGRNLEKTMILDSALNVFDDWVKKKKKMKRQRDMLEWWASPSDHEFQDINTHLRSTKRVSFDMVNV